MRDLIFIAIVVACSIVALRRPVFGLLVFVCFGFFNPQGMTWSWGRSFPFAQFTGIATILGYSFWSEPKRFPRQREAFLLLALWGVFGISTLFAIYPDIAMARFIHVSKILLMVVLSMSIINTEHRLLLLLRVIAFSLGFYGLKGGFFAVISGGGYMVWGPEESFLYANNAIGMALTMNIPILIYLLKFETNKWLRWMIKAMIFFSYPAVICTFSRGAWLGLAVVTGLMVWKSRRRFMIITVAGILAIVLLPILSQTLPQRVVERYDDLVNYKEEASAESRFWNWEFCKRVGLSHPLTGGGFEYYSKELYAVYFPEFIARWGSQKVWSCHSIWYTIFGEHGFPGLIFWIGLLGSYLLSLRKMRASASRHPEMSWAVHCADMLQSAVLAYMVVGTFLDAAYFDMFYYLIAILVISKEMIARKLMHYRAVAASSSVVVTDREQHAY